MGHVNNAKQVYKNLRTRLDRYPVGAPESEEIYEILKILYTAEEAEIAARMPMKPAALDEIHRRCGKDKKSLAETLDKMADKGLVIDFESERSGEKVYFLAPTLPGFVEFSMMRVREDINQKYLAELCHKLFDYDNYAFVKEVFKGKTQISRALVQETALTGGNYSEVLTYERATELIKASKFHGVSLCYCRHKAQHVNQACDNPVEICMTINMGAEYLIKHKLAREISVDEMLKLLEEARERGLVQMCDNVKNEPTFICNCCGCCCGMLMAINKAKIKNAVMTSNFIASVDASICKGCGKCAKRCPINAIELKEKKTGGKKKKYAVVDKSICLGCGVCHRGCKFEALSMKKRKQRVITPETAVEKIITMALERGKLQNLIFDEPGNLTNDFLSNMVGALLKLPPVKQVLLQKEVKSRFIDAALKRAQM